MKSSISEWQRLVSAVRRAPDQPAASSPYGFSTRVAARVQGHRQSGAATDFARFSWRALAVAALVTGATVAANFEPVMNRLADDADALSDLLPDAEESGV